MYLSAVSLSYLAWAGVHASDPKRVPSDRLGPRLRKGLRFGGYALGLFVLAVCTVVMGAERGLFTATWLLTFAGAALAFTVVIFPRAHRVALGASAALAVIGLVSLAL